MTANATPKKEGWRNRITGHGEVDPATLTANPRNWRTHPKQQRDALEAAIDRVGFVQGVIVNTTTGHVVDGHLRVDLAMERHEQSIAVDYVELTEEEEAVVLATLDPLSAMAGRDQDVLDDLLASVDPGEGPLAALLSQSLGELGGDTEPDEPAETPYVQRGDVWQVGEHRIMCGDSTDGGDVAMLLDGERVDLIVTSPPYNQGIDGFKPSGMHAEADWVPKVARMAYADQMPEDEYQSWQAALLDQWMDIVIRDGGSVFYNHKIRYRDKAAISPLRWLPGPFTLRQEIIWSRPGSVTQNARMFLPSDERVYWMYAGDDFYFDDSTEIKTWSSVWSFAPERTKDHAVPFPVELPTRSIVACSKRGGDVYDPFLGSGTTAVAAANQGRTCYGMEISPAYAQVSIERLAKHIGAEPVRVDG